MQFNKIKPLSAAERREKISMEQGQKIMSRNFVARSHNQKVMLQIRTGTASDFEFVGEGYAKAIQTHISDTTKTRCGDYLVIRIEKIQLSLATDDITAKLLSKSLIKQLQLANTIVIASADFIFDDGFFAALGFKKLWLEGLDGETPYFYWASNRIFNKLCITTAAAA